LKSEASTKTWLGVGVGVGVRLGEHEDAPPRRPHRPTLSNRRGRTACPDGEGWGEGEGEGEGWG
jgi:hypothetical protein